MTSKIKLPKIFSIIILLFFLIFLAKLLVTSIQNFQYYTNKKYKEVKNIAEKQSANAAHTFDRIFKPTIKKIDSVALIISKNAYPQYEIKKILQNILQKNREIYAINIRYTPFIKQQKNKYVQTFNKNIETNTPIEVYQSPIYSRQGNKKILIGVVSLEYPTTYIEEIMQAVKKNENGYSFITKTDGNLVTFPISSYVTEGKNIYDLKVDWQTEQWDKIGKKIKQNQKYSQRLIDNRTKKEAEIFLNPIQCLKWNYITVFLYTQENIDIKKVSLSIIGIVSQFLGFMLLFLTVLVMFFNVKRRALWISIYSFSFFLLLGIATIWYLAINDTTDHSQNSIKVFDRTSLSNFVEKTKKQTQKLCNKSMNMVEVGLLIDNLQFNSTTQIRINGIIWEKIHEKDTSAIKFGILFKDADSQKLKELYTKKDKTKITKGWRFEILLNNFGNFTKYPFDKRNIKLTITSADFDKQILVLPDLQSYKFIASSLKPGLEKDLNIPGWNILFTNFEYTFNEYMTNFGIEKLDCANYFNELSFKIGIQRNFINPFISRIIPIFVIFIILFFLLLLLKKTDDSMGRVLTVSGAFFFTVILAQSSLREEVKTDNIVFFEFFYFIVYFLLIFNLMNAFLYIKREKMKFVQYKDNLIPKLIYWPIILTSIYIISAFVLF